MVAKLISFVTGSEPLPGYRLCHFLGRGGYGEVWKATDPNGREVALKFIPCSGRRSASREIRAIQSVRQVRHPNLIDTYQVCADARYLIIVMELAEGSLLDLFDIYMDESGGPIPAKDLCFYLGQVASALDFLNTRQHHISGRLVAVRHCDVKPSNLLVFGDTIKLTDFSLSVQATAPMWYYERVGTLDYAAPEVFQGSLSDRTDQFSLGVTYFYLRTGEFPYPVPPRGFERNYCRPAPDLSPLDAKEQPIVARALSATPHDRWPSCAEFIRHLCAIHSS